MATNPTTRSPLRRGLFSMVFALLALALLPTAWAQTVANITRGQENDAVFPVVTIHSTGDVMREEIASFVLEMKPGHFTGTYVNFSVSGTAVPGVDYVPPASPAYIGPSGYGTILVQTLPDPRDLFVLKSYSIVITLEPGGPYDIGAPASAKVVIRSSP